MSRFYPVNKRVSKYGFYCADCEKFVYRGYDRRDKEDLPRGSAVCLDCGDKYPNKKVGSQKLKLNTND